MFEAASGRGADRVLGTVIPIGSGLAGWVVSSGQTLEISEVADDPRFARDVAEQTGYVPRSLLAAPLETRDGTVGVVEVLDRGTGDDQGERDLVTLALFARLAAETVVSARLFTQMGTLLLGSLATHASDGLAAALGRAAEQAGPTPTWPTWPCCSLACRQPARGSDGSPSTCSPGSSRTPSRRRRHDLDARVGLAVRRGPSLRGRWAGTGRSDLAGLGLGRRDRRRGQGRGGRQRGRGRAPGRRSAGRRGGRGHRRRDRRDRARRRPARRPVRPRHRVRRHHPAGRAGLRALQRAGARREPARPGGGLRGRRAVGARERDAGRQPEPRHRRAPRSSARSTGWPTRRTSPAAPWSAP